MGMLLPTIQAQSKSLNKELSVTNSKSNSREVIFHTKEPGDSDSDEEIKGDDIEESSTLNPPEDTPRITEFTDVFLNDNTLIQIDDVFLKNPLDKLSSKCDIQHAIESDSEEVIYQVDTEACGGEDIAHTCIRQTLLIHLLVVSSTFSQSKEKDDGKGIATFHTFTKIGDKNYKVIVDCESCVNTVSSEVFGTDGLKSIPHSHLFKVPWIKFTAL